MIGKLNGLIDELKPTEVILDINGVGYHVYIPISTFEKIQNLNNVVLYIHTYVREDIIKLYGFYTQEEKLFFNVLLGISGIGPSMAISILSGISISSLLDAVKNDNVKILTKVPGIGKTKAEKLVFELKRKIKKLDSIIDTDIDNSDSPAIRQESIEALVALGYDEKKGSALVDDLLQKDGNYSLEQIIKESLKILSQ